MTPPPMTAVTLLGAVAYGATMAATFGGGGAFLIQRRLRAGLPLTLVGAGMWVALFAMIAP